MPIKTLIQLYNVTDNEQRLGFQVPKRSSTKSTANALRD